MNYASWLFLGVFLTFATAWVALVFVPNEQLKDLQSQQDEITGELHPAPFTGAQTRGMRVYVANGCVYCHSQQVRGGDWNADLERGWGLRRSHPKDYIYDLPQQLGTMRTGPDLANIGVRQPSPAWHYLHLYDPEITSPGSNMPPHPFLFEKRKVAGERSADALKLEGEWAVGEAWEVVPRAEARDLVKYLQRLDQSYEIED